MLIEREVVCVNEPSSQTELASPSHDGKLSIEIKLSTSPLDFNAAPIVGSTSKHQGDKHEEVSPVHPGDDVDALSTPDDWSTLVRDCGYGIVGDKEGSEVGVVECRAREANDGEEGGVGTKSIVLEVNGELGSSGFN